MRRSLKVSLLCILRWSRVFVSENQKSFNCRDYLEILLEWSRRCSVNSPYSHWYSMTRSNTNRRPNHKMRPSASDLIQSNSTTKTHLSEQYLTRECLKDLPDPSNNISLQSSETSAIFTSNNISLHRQYLHLQTAL